MPRPSRDAEQKRRWRIAARCFVAGALFAAVSLGIELVDDEPAAAGSVLLSALTISGAVVGLLAARPRR